MSLRTRWAMTLALVAAMAIGLAVATSLVITENHLRREIDADLLSRAGTMPGDMRDLFLGGFPGRGDRPVSFDAIVQIITPDGQIVGFEGAPPLPVTDEDLARVTGGNPRLLRNVTVDDTPHRMITAHNRESTRGRGGPSRR